MRCNYINRIGKNNKGLSLVELLVAIAIFVAAIIPMLYAFVYSTGYNYKSQQTFQSTGIAQAVIERCKGKDVHYEDIIGMLDDKSIFTNDSSLSDSISGFNIAGITAEDRTFSGEGYWFYNVKAQRNTDYDSSTSRRAYDVNVQLIDLDEGYTDTSIIQTMSNATANFCDYNGFVNNLKSSDDSAYTQLFTLITNKVLNSDSNVVISGHGVITGSHSEFTTDDFDLEKINIDRKITVIATCDADDLSDGKVTILVEYFADYDGTNVFKTDAKDIRVSGVDYTGAVCQGKIEGLDGDNDTRYDHGNGTHPFYRASFDATADDTISGTYFTGSAPSAIYFYYYPRYTDEPDKANFRDHIFFENNMTKCYKEGSTPINKLDIYLFKQYRNDFSPAILQICEQNYAPDIVVTSTDIDTYLYHNLPWKLSRAGSVYRTELINPIYYTINVDNTGNSAHCYNMTVHETGTKDPGAVYSSGEVKYNNYASTFYHTQVESDPIARGCSYLLSDYAIVPYYHPNVFLHDMPRMYQSRFEVDISVYPSTGSPQSSGEIETMTANILNW